MSLPLKQFGRNLVASRLMTRDELADFLQRLPSSKQPRDGERLARLLVKKKLLTKYQASMLYHGQTQHLVFGDYVVLERIGSGGMGHVFKARHRKMDGLVALKAMTPEGAKKGSAVKRFQREVRLSARLKHQNIVTTYDTSEQDGAPYLVMEYVDGHDLSVLVKQTGPLDVGLAVDCVSQAARALRHAHAHDVIHRDIKPANLLLDKRGVVKILDLGVARMGDGADDHSLLAAEAGSARVLVGTVDYMSPEQARDANAADARSDIYSLGCVLYYLLAGKRPYDGETVQARLRGHREAPIPLPRDVRDDVPESLEAVYLRMVAKDPGQRYASMSELIVALDRRDGETPAEREPETPANGSAESSLENLFARVGPEDTLLDLPGAAMDSGEAPVVQRAPRLDIRRRSRRGASRQRRLMLYAGLAALALILALGYVFAKVVSAPDPISAPHPQPQQKPAPSDRGSAVTLEPTYTRKT